MNKKDTLIFSPEIPPDLEHASLIREEALDWLETHYPGELSFTTGAVLRMAGEPSSRWLITRLRARDIGNQEEFSLPDTADALAILFLRSKGVKFLDAVESVIGRKELSGGLQPRYGGVWNRLIIAALDGMRRRIPARLLASVVFSLLPEPQDQFNCLVVVKRRGKQIPLRASEKATPVNHDYVYRNLLERPSPSCSVISPSREVMFFGRDQLPSRSEVTSRQYFSLRASTELENYELLVGTMRSVSITPDSKTMQFVGRILDIVYIHFEAFLTAQLSARLESPIEPEPTAAPALQLWLTTKLLSSIYPGSLCEISEGSPTSQVTRVLASSVAKPWEPSPWEPAKSLEMLSGYVSRTGVPLIVEKVEHPWTQIIESVESEMRYLKSQAANDKIRSGFSALALPITSGSGNSTGSLYMLMPQPAKHCMETEVRVLTVMSRIVGEIIERHRAAVYTSEVVSNIVSLNVLKREQFKTALLDLLNRKASELSEDNIAGRDTRLPFLLVSAHGPEPDQINSAISVDLKNWLVDTLCHLEWRSFVRSHWPGTRLNFGVEGFMGEVPQIGIMLTLGNLVSKDELDQLRNVFPTTFNQISPSNSPVKLVAWILDVPAQRILEAAKSKKLPDLADEIEGWAFNVATLVDDLAQSSVLAHETGEWEAALKKIRQALQKPAAQNNSYLRRLAVDCSLALGDWPGALKYAQEAVAMSGHELGSGLVRSLCLEADTHLCLCDPVRAWDLYSEAAAKSPAHPLPRYYRGQALLLIARLLNVYEDERRRTTELKDKQLGQLDQVINTLVNVAMDDLTSAADLLERWGLIPESYQYRNFHLVPTLLGQGLGYLLTRSPGPAASRLQSARRSFPKDDLFFREFLFAKCWEQGVHRKYAELLLSGSWDALRIRLSKTIVV